MQLAPSYALCDLAILRSSLLNLIATDPSPLVKTDALEHASAPLVQMLIAAHLTARNAGTALQITCPPEGALARAFERMGICEASDADLHIENGLWVALSAAT